MHRCFVDELDFDEVLNKWVCSVCRRPYSPPQRFDKKVPNQEYWMPWKHRSPVLLFPRVALYWEPWRRYDVVWKRE